jgi:TRAP-type mannitol/chloroaromatic compound transport system permease small subunit
MRRFIRAVDLLSSLLFRVGMCLLALLISAMVYEVVARRLFNSPTLWAADVSYMANGVIFVLAAPYLLRQRAHIAIDFLAVRLSERVRKALDGAFLLLGLIPTTCVLAYAACSDALEAFQTGRLEWVSPWAPKVWPFLSAIALGVVVLMLQAVAQATGLFGDGAGRSSASDCRRSQEAF